MNWVRLVSVLTKVFAQPGNQMPDARNEQRRKNRTADETKRLPQRRLDHSDEERGQKQRDRRKHCSLSRGIFAPIVLKDLIDDAIPTRLRCNVARALCVRIIRI